MSRRIFTEEEAELLRSNPFTYRVTDSRIVFTREFKELFMNEFDDNGLSARQIIIKYGYDPDILGSNRINALSSLFRKDLQKKQDLSERKKQALTVSGEEVTVDTIRKMQERIEYLEQEMEFLKKISSTGTFRK